MKISKNAIISAVILIVVVGGIGYYLWQKNAPPANQLPPDFNVMDKSISSSDLQQYVNKFNEAKQKLRVNPNDFYALLDLGMVKKYIGDYQGAEQAWIEAGKLEPANSTSFGNLADLYVNFLHQYDKAAAAYETAMNNSVKDPFYVNFVRNAFYFYRDYVKDNQKAEQVLLTGLKNKPQSTDIIILLAGYYRDQGDKAKALYYFQKALAIDPKDETVAQEIKKLQ